MARSASRMVRKQIYLEAAQDRLLKRLAAEAGVSEAEVIRQAVARHAAQTRASARDADAWHRQRRRIRASIARGPLDGTRNWTREDLYAQRLGRLG
jgi:hypothetical protein